MANDTIKLEGFKELHRNLGNLTKATERGVLRRVATQALEPVVELAKQLVPVDQGRLRDSIIIANSLSQRARRNERDEPKGGVKVYAGTNSRTAVVTEYGSWKQPPRPYMRPAWDSQKNKVLKFVGYELGAEIEKAAARAARRKR